MSQGHQNDQSNQFGTSSEDVMQLETPAGSQGVQQDQVIQYEQDQMEEDQVEHHEQYQEQMEEDHAMIEEELDQLTEDIYDQIEEIRTVNPMLGELLRQMVKYTNSARTTVIREQRLRELSDAIDEAQRAIVERLERQERDQIEKDDQEHDAFSLDHVEFDGEEQDEEIENDNPVTEDHPQVPEEDDVRTGQVLNSIVLSMIAKTKELDQETPVQPIEANSVSEELSPEQVAVDAIQHIQNPPPQLMDEERHEMQRQINENEVYDFNGNPILIEEVPEILRHQMPVFVPLPRTRNQLKSLRNFKGPIVRYVYNKMIRKDLVCIKNIKEHLREIALSQKTSIQAFQNAHPTARIFKFLLFIDYDDWNAEHDLIGIDIRNFESECYAIRFSNGMEYMKIDGPTTDEIVDEILFTSVENLTRKVINDRERLFFRLFDEFWKKYGSNTADINRKTVFAKRLHHIFVEANRLELRYRIFFRWYENEQQLVAGNPNDSAEVAPLFYDVRYREENAEPFKVVAWPPGVDYNAMRASFLPFTHGQCVGLDFHLGQ